jgi:hypothetical protein
LQPDCTRKALARVCQAVHHRLAFTQLVRIVEVGEFAAGKARVGVDQRLNDLPVDLVASHCLQMRSTYCGRSRRST